MAEGGNQSNAVRAGAFILTTAVLGLIVVIVLTKTNFLKSSNDYTLKFEMSDGVAGLEVGAEVRVAGLKVGRVNDIEEHFEEDRIDVSIEMDSTIAIYQDAIVLRSQPLLGNYSWINFISLGTKAKGQVANGGSLDATPSGGLLATIVGPQNAGRANQMFADLTQFTGSLANFAEVQYPQQVVPLLNNAASLAESLKQDYGTWRGDVSTTLKSASSAATKLDGAMDDAKQVASDARVMVSHFREKNMAQIDRVLDEAETGAASFANALQTLDVEIATRLPDLRAMLADLRTAAAQVKLATMEVRRSPWKLLYRPDSGELSRENLYEAARAFALASSDLRVAGETLEAAVRAAPERFEGDARFRKAVQDEVTGSLARYKSAQQKLFDVLLDGQAPPTGSEQVSPPFAAPPPAPSAKPASATKSP